MKLHFYSTSQRQQGTDVLYNKEIKKDILKLSRLKTKYSRTTAWLQKPIKDE